jgi:flagellum-specific ATP synthase
MNPAAPTQGSPLVEEGLCAPRIDYLSRLRHLDLLKVNGSVKQVIGLVIESVGPNCALGDVCVIKSKDGQDLCLSKCQVRDNRVLSMILGDAARVRSGGEIVATDHVLSAPVGEELLGRVLDGLGHLSTARGRS